MKNRYSNSQSGFTPLQESHGRKHVDEWHCLYKSYNKMPRALARGRLVTGFTLIETLIYIAIIGTAVTSFVVFSLNVSDSRNKSYVVQEVHGNARMALDVISSKIRNAADVVSPPEGSSSNVLILDMPGTDTRITFVMEDRILRMGESGIGTTSITADEITVRNLTFSNLAPTVGRDHIRIQAEFEFHNPSGDDQFNYSYDWTTGVSIRQ